MGWPAGFLTSARGRVLFTMAAVAFYLALKPRLPYWEYHAVILAGLLAITVAVWWDPFQVPQLRPIRSTPPSRRTRPRADVKKPAGQPMRPAR